MRISDWSSDVCSSDLQHDPYPGHSVLHSRFWRPLRRYGKASEPACRPQASAIDRPAYEVRRFRRPCPCARDRCVRARRRLWSHSLVRSEEHTSELQSLMRLSYAVFCFKKTTTTY